MTDTNPALTVPTLTSDRLTLEPLSRTHSQGMFALWSHPAVCRYAGHAHDLEGRAITLPAQAPSDSDKIIDVFVQGAADGTRCRWALLTKPDGAFIGAAGFNTFGACPEYAYHLHPALWGRGFMTEASQSLLRWLRHRPGCLHVEAFIDPSNTASITLATRLGFHPTGETRDSAARYAMSCRDA